MNLTRNLPFIACFFSFTWLKRSHKAIFYQSKIRWLIDYDIQNIMNDPNIGDITTYDLRMYTMLKFEISFTLMFAEDY